MSRVLPPLLALLALARGAVRLVCNTSIEVSGGVMEIELWPHTAPLGVQRVLGLANADFFTDLPFFHASLQLDFVLFGLSPDASKQRMWDEKGDIDDDAFPRNGIHHNRGDEGLLCFSGDPKKRYNSRSTILLLTLVRKRFLSNRQTPWEVPVGKVVHGLDVLKAVYTGYGTEPHMPFLNATNDKRPETVPDPATYVKEHFPKLDRFLGCRTERNEEIGSDPNHPSKHDEL